MSKNNEKSILLSQFEAKVEDGPVKFRVLNAMYDDIPTKNGVKEIVKLELELQELNNADGSTEVKEINLFVDFTPRGHFYKFVNAAITALSTTSFQPSKLIGLKGEAVLSHYQPEGSDFSYPRINNWVFYQRNDKVAKALEQYQKDDGIDFDEGGDEIV
ncbi:hypothetical protein [Pseudogracilibacillus sp. SO10305]|uniref:hypothetical protein n=1 Tax=Pseudogracilibacillus sp. SO10305 TaxID=3098292 RepID=UPI00300DE7D4